MKFCRLRLQDFAGIRELDVEFGPGLNVLYGPNDLGKSTIADAIRLALLLPHGSKDAEPFVRWAANRDHPVVELTFETDTQRIWRVRKEFGQGGSSLLQESRNGEDFDDVERARKVDARLREILSWGLPELGGSGSGRGIPSSFLATALLSTQSEVDAILGGNLEADSTSSGRERIAAALEAVAQDPVFAALLKSVQERRDQAFTEKGAKKNAQTSVFRIAAERVTRARQERDEIQKAVTDSEGAEATLRRLNEEHGRSLEAWTNASDHAALMERILAAEKEAHVARENVDRIQKISDEVRNAEKRVTELEEAERRARQQLTVAQTESSAAEAALKAAEDEASRALSENSDAANTVHRQEIELRLAAAKHSAATANQQMNRIAEAQQLAEAAYTAERNCADQETKAHAAGRAAVQAGEESRTAAERLNHCDVLERGVELRSAEKQEAAARTAAERHSNLNASLETASRERSALAERRSTITIPDLRALPAMRRLAQDLGAARAALDVGFVVSVVPKHPMEIRVRKDTDTRQSHSLTDPMEVEANAEVEVDIPNVASIQIRGGRREARESAQILEARWKGEVEPHLAAAAVADLPGLEAKIEEAQKLDTELKTRDRDLLSLREQIAGLADAAGVLQEAILKVETRRAALGSIAMESLAAELDSLGSDPATELRKQRTRLNQAAGQARDSLARASAEQQVQEERLAHHRDIAAEARSKRDLALQAFPAGLDQTRSQVQSDLTAAAASEESLTAELNSLDATIRERKIRVEQAAAGARSLRDQARKRMDDAQTGLNAAIALFASQRGLLEALTKQRDSENFPAAEACLDAAIAQRDLLPALELPVTDSDVAAAREKARNLKSDLDRVSADIQRAHGALAQVGGAVARERLRDATEALELAEQQEKEVEAEYEAWKLLLEQMKEADAAQAGNLGQVLTPAITGKFVELTERRYEHVALGAHLGAEGIVCAGAVRPPDRISVGTREQLSTLYRLALAEYLGMPIVLDDQLVQSDETRMDWFRVLLKEKSRAFQIVVLTCRATDYLEKGAIVGRSKTAWLDSNDGFTRAFDLRRLLMPLPTRAAGKSKS